MNEVPQPPQQRPFEDVVITIVIAIGLLGGVTLLFIGGDTTAAAILFCLAVTSFTYRFLGGIDKSTTLTVGTLKVTGTVAVLLGSFLLFDSRLADPVGSADVRFDPPLTPEALYIFDPRGEPVPLIRTTIRDGDTLVARYPPPGRERFRSTPRHLAMEEGRVYVLSESDSIYLGVVTRDAERLGEDLLTAEQLLALGQYYSTPTGRGGTPPERRNPALAIRYLSRLLERNDPEAEAHKDRAQQQLFFLQAFFNRAETFELLIAATEDHRAGYNRFLELGDTWLTFANRAGSLDRDAALLRRRALRSYLEYLSTGESTLDQLANRTGAVKREVENLVQVFLGDDPLVSGKTAAILRAVADHDRSALFRLSREVGGE